MCGDRNEGWKKFRDNYKELFREEKNWLEPKHTVSCVLGCFLYNYKKHYKTNFALVPNSPNPFSSKEVKDIWKLISAFDGNALDVRKYILWFFSKKIKGSTNITSIAYLNTPNIIREFKIKLEKSKHYTRASKLPPSFIKWCQDNEPSIFNTHELSTMNDLGSILFFTKVFGKSVPNSSENAVIKRAEEMGLIKNGRINIKE